MTAYVQFDLHAYCENHSQFLVKTVSERADSCSIGRAALRHGQRSHISLSKWIANSGEKQLQKVNEQEVMMGKSAGNCSEVQLCCGYQMVWVPSSGSSS